MLPKRDALGVLSGVCQRFDEDQSLDLLSKRSGWSKFYLHRGFKRTFGETPKQYTLRLRLERAAALLAAGSETVLDIAVSVGFSGHEVFIRAFRRQYGCTPTHYRSEALKGASRSERSRHQNAVRSIGPCVRLYYASLNQEEGIDMVSPNIERKDVAAQPIIFIQRRAARTQLQPLFAECFPKLFTHCIQTGLAMAGQPIARYVSTGSGLWTVDCAIPLAEPASSEGEMQAGQLPSGPVAFAVHEGAYERLAETNAAIEQWIEDNGLQCNGPAWECYVTDPAQHPDPADWKTEIYWPLAE